MELLTDLLVSAGSLVTPTGNLQAGKRPVSEDMTRGDFEEGIALAPSPRGDGRGELTLKVVTALSALGSHRSWARPWEE